MCVRDGRVQARLFAAGGVNKVRLTGGEPTLRKGEVVLVWCARLRCVRPGQARALRLLTCSFFLQH